MSNKQYTNPAILADTTNPEESKKEQKWVQCKIASLLQLQRQATECGASSEFMSLLAGERLRACEQYLGLLLVDPNYPVRDLDWTRHCNSIKAEDSPKDTIYTAQDRITAIMDALEERMA